MTLRTDVRRIVKRFKGYSLEEEGHQTLADFIGLLEKKEPGIIADMYVSGVGPRLVAEGMSLKTIGKEIERVVDYYNKNGFSASEVWHQRFRKHYEGGNFEEIHYFDVEIGTGDELRVSKMYGGGTARICFKETGSEETLKNLDEEIESSDIE